MMRKLLAAMTRAWVPPFRLANPPTRRVAIVVPLTMRPELTADEAVSMRHLVQHLGGYNKYLIVAKGQEVDIPGFGVKRFARKYFGSAAAHGKLLGSPAFYREFLDYEFIFFYHLDSLVFFDQLAEWCASDLDYIGAPWIRCDDTAWVDRPRVGNGGFTLLRVVSALKVLANRHRLEPSTYWLDLFTHSAPRWLVRGLQRVQARFPNNQWLNRVMQEWREMDDPGLFGRNNDLFWSDRAVRYLPDFKVASLEQGLRFAFEASPRTCLEMAGGRMPFGCHAWGRYDRDFWQPLLLRDESPRTGGLPVGGCGRAPIFTQ